MTRIAYALLLALLLPSCSKQEPIEKARMDAASDVRVGAFNFLERAGVPLSDKDLKGKVWIATLIFTRCPTSCVTMCAEMAELQEEFADDPDFRIVATTCDPAYDTADVLDKFARTYDAKPDRWYFLTGRLEDIRKFAVEGLRLPWKADDPVNHSIDFVLVDRDGTIRDYFRQIRPDEMKRMRAVIRDLLAKKAP